MRLALLLALLLALPAQAGTGHWLRLTWRAPCDPLPNGFCATCAEYHMRRADVGLTGWVAVPLVMDTLTMQPVVPGIPGTWETGYAWEPTTEAQWRRGGTEWALRSRDYAGNWSGWSNRVLRASGPDTVWFLQHTSDPALAHDYFDAKSGPTPEWDLPWVEGDNVRAVHCEEVNRAEAANVCRLFLGTRTSGIWWLRGAPQQCTVFVPDSIRNLHVAPKVAPMPRIPR